jgi:hypothetical protein
MSLSIWICIVFHDFDNVFENVYRPTPAASAPRHHYRLPTASTGRQRRQQDSSLVAPSRIVRAAQTTGASTVGPRCVTSEARDPESLADMDLHYWVYRGLDSCQIH